MKTCRNCKYHSDVRGVRLLTKTIFPNQEGHCILFNINLDNIIPCEQFKMR